MIDETNLRQIQYTILGTLLREPEHVGEVTTMLSPTDFTELSTMGLYDAICKLHFDGAPIDPVTVCKAAGEDYEAAITEVMKYHTRDVPYYCGLLREYTKLHNVQGYGYALSASGSLDEANGIIDKLNGILVTRKKTEVVSAGDAAEAFLSQQDTQEKPEYMRFGLKALDDVSYIEPGDFVVIGGYPSAGKTLMSLQFAIALAEKYRVGYFSLETNTKKLTDRLMAHMAQVPLQHIKRHELTDTEWDSVAKASVKLSKLQIDFIRAAGMTVRDIQAVALNQRYQVVFVDYLQLVTAAGKNRFEQVTNVSMGLHTMSQNQGITVVALAQLTRPDKSYGKPQPPSMQSFRESGQIEQDADLALLLWLDDPNDNRSNRIMKVGKNKEGDKVQVEFEFDGATQTLTPASQQKKVAQQFIDAGKAVKEKARYAKTAQVPLQVLPDNYEIPF